MRIGPAPTHQVSVPTEQRLGPDEESDALGPRQQAAQSGKQGPISRSKRRPGDLTTRDRNLVTEDDDLDGQISSVAPLQTQKLKHPNEREDDVPPNGGEVISGIVDGRSIWRHLPCPNHISGA